MEFRAHRHTWGEPGQHVISQVNVFEAQTAVPDGPAPVCDLVVEAGDITIRQPITADEAECLANRLREVRPPAPASELGAAGDLKDLPPPPSLAAQMAGRALPKFSTGAEVQAAMDAAGFAGKAVGFTGQAVPAPPATSAPLPTVSPPPGVVCVNGVRIEVRPGERYRVATDHKGVRVRFDV